MIIRDIVQRSEEWRQLKLGKVGASRVADIVARTKSGYSASRENYLTELLLERITGFPADRFQSDAMRYGTEMEPLARAAYSFDFDVEVEQIAFATHPSIEMAGASPDGLVGKLGLVEIKVPQPATHLDTLLSEKVPEKYIIQMNWQMCCTEREFCDFVSYNPSFPPAAKMFVKRIPRDDAMISHLEGEVRAFLADLDKKLEELNRVMERRAA